MKRFINKQVLRLLQKQRLQRRQLQLPLLLHQHRLENREEAVEDDLRIADGDQCMSTTTMTKSMMMNTMMKKKKNFLRQENMQDEGIIIDHRVIY